MKKPAKTMAPGKMPERDFTLVLTGITELSPEVENALFEAGCDDATLSMRSGRPFLTFSRAAETLCGAILSAIEDVWKADCGLDVLRVDYCDLVTQAEIARRISRPRQVVHQYINGTRGPGAFPPPICHISDDSPLWAWCEVAYWLHENDLVQEEILEDALAKAVINDALELRFRLRCAPKTARDILELIKLE